MQLNYSCFWSDSHVEAMPFLVSCPTSLSPRSLLPLQEECRGLREGHAGLEQQLASAQSTVAIEQTEKTKLQQEVQESKKEQDDLLMLLADQDQKILNLKQRLRDLGETVGETICSYCRSRPCSQTTEEDPQSFKGLCYYYGFSGGRW